MPLLSFLYIFVSPKNNVPSFLKLSIALDDIITNNNNIIIMVLYFIFDLLDVSFGRVGR